MRFLDDNIKLHINGLIFKAYLEDSDITHNVRDQALPFAPLSFNNDSMATRVNETAKFTFNVFSETRGECIQNFNNLLKLIRSIKPIYEIVDYQYVPDFSNLTGLVELFFSGMPSRDIVKLHLNNFNYSINKELGYIQVPREEILDYKKSTEVGFYSPGNMKLIPLAYKISLEGKVLLPFDQTVRLINGRTKGSDTTFFSALSTAAQSNSAEYLNMLVTLYKGITGGKSLYAVKDEYFADVVGKLKTLKDSYLADVNSGNFRSDVADDGQRLEDTIPLTDNIEAIVEAQDAVTNAREARRETYMTLRDEIKKLQ